MLSVDHIRRLVIVPALAPFPATMRTRAAVELLIGTALCESMLTFLRQGLRTPGDGLGVALGLYQIEPRSHADLWQNYLSYRPILSQLASASGQRPDSDLVSDLSYATRIARLFYWRAPQRLPAAHDIEGLAQLWKAAYNTPDGKGTPQHFIDVYRQFA